MSKAKLDAQLAAIGKTDKDAVKVLLLGNTGVGKSFLCNLLLGKQAFESAFSATSVTDHNGFELFVHEGTPYLLYDVPGLLEADEENIARNKEAIQDAIADRPAASTVVLFVFGHQNGRLNADDLVAYKAVTDYLETLDDVSHAVVVNSIPAEYVADAAFRAEVSRQVHQFLGRQMRVELLPTLPGAVNFQSHGAASYRSTVASLVRSLSAMHVQAKANAHLQLQLDRESERIRKMNELMQQQEQRLKQQHAEEERRRRLADEDNARAAEERRIQQEAERQQRERAELERRRQEQLVFVPGLGPCLVVNGGLMPLQAGFGFHRGPIFY